MILEQFSTILSKYGILGAWTLFLLWEKIDYKKNVKILILNNTKALTLVNQSIKKCKKK